MSKLQSFHQFCLEINESKSRNHKISVLEKYKTHEHIEFIKYILNFVFNSFKITGISYKKLFKKIDIDTKENFTEFEELLEWILENKTGSDYVVATVRDHLEWFSESDDELLETLQRIVVKDLPLGISETTINKVYTDLIPTFDLMLAEKYIDNKERIQGKSITITRKLDGNRCLLFNHINGPIMLTRQGKLYEGLVQIEQEASLLPKGYVYDGELIIDGEDLSAEEKYRLTTGTLHKKGTKKKDLIFHVFDVVSIDEFNQQLCTAKYSERLEFLQTKLTSVNTPHIRLVDVLYQGLAEDEVIQRIVKEQTELGEEGIMINLNDATYKFKRCKDLLKVKLFNSADVRVVGYYEGTGEFIGTLGGVTVEFIAPDHNLYTANCGSGFKLDERRSLWENPEQLIGQIIEINYFEISQNKEGEYSLRFPTFKRLRPDKDSISMY